MLDPEWLLFSPFLLLFWVGPYLLLKLLFILFSLPHSFISLSPSIVNRASTGSHQWLINCCNKFGRCWNSVPLWADVMLGGLGEEFPTGSEVIKSVQAYSAGQRRLCRCGLRWKGLLGTNEANFWLSLEGRGFTAATRCEWFWRLD